jgi:hypothetical protein
MFFNVSSTDKGGSLPPASIGLAVAIRAAAPVYSGTPRSWGLRPAARPLV